MQPLIINLTGRKVVIAGAGRIAARKARVLHGEQALITFIAPQMSEEVLQLAEEKNYTLIHRKAEPSDFADAALVILATNDRIANQALSKALPAHQLVCVVDEFEEGNVTFPATIRRGYLQVAVTSNGSSPKLTRKLKKELEAQFDSSWEPYTAFLKQCRDLIKQLPLSFEEKSDLLWELLEDPYRMNEELQKKKWNELYAMKE
ncbi:precorrin-2 dehydrogenase/sirohydrochlorin ferrochelatase family protein [Jeotgalibacillus campisalis]|uniref:precorrin-2 dehydrogenase n=1 Tax=Jeotgalibacillus campisalis TaxID=220754 RepID=A0A0C2SCS0_9BACL|nr:NAD(P)-dependent oxidoreductase [Jeotgalibacillus campisalis]KIL51764.1 potassium transporter Trk [Jeotgalibacillus campisalis]